MAKSNPARNFFQVRTNKHRCFVFCHGHTSLTCVPGIGEKNKRLLNQSGIGDLTTLYAQYRTMNSSRKFQEWLVKEIGFTSYQAQMTTCGIRSKLGFIKEIDTGLTPICCPSIDEHEENYLNTNVGQQRRRNTKIRKKQESDSSEVNRLESTMLIKNHPYKEINQDQIRSNKVLSKSSEEILSLTNMAELSHSINGKVNNEISDKFVQANENKLKEKVDMIKEKTADPNPFASTRPSAFDPLLDIDEKVVGTSLTPSIESGHLRKSILRRTQSRSILQFNSEVLSAVNKQQKQSQSETSVSVELTKTDRNKRALNYKIDSDLRQSEDRSISALKRAYALSPLSTPAIFPIKSRTFTSAILQSTFDSKSNLSQEKTKQCYPEKYGATEGEEVERQSISPNQNAIVPSERFPQKSDDNAHEHRSSLIKCITLAERFAQIKAKQLSKETNSSLKSLTTKSNVNSKSEEIFQKQISITTEPNHSSSDTPLPIDEHKSSTKAGSPLPNITQSKRADPKQNEQLYNQNLFFQKVDIRNNEQQWSDSPSTLPCSSLWENMSNGSIIEP